MHRTEVIHRHPFGAIATRADSRAQDTDGGRAASPLLRAGCGAVAAAVMLTTALVVYVLGIVTCSGQITDQQAMTAFSAVFGVDRPTAGVLDELQFPVWAAAVAGVGIACCRRRSVRTGAYAATVIVGSIVGAVLLKHGLTRPDLGVGPALNSYPSNTVAAYAGVALALTAAVGPAARRYTAVLAGLTVATVAAAVIALQWHRPTDVLGGLLVAGTTAAAARALCAITRARGRSAAAPDGR